MNDANRLQLCCRPALDNYSSEVSEVLIQFNNCEKFSNYEMRLIQLERSSAENSDVIIQFSSNHAGAVKSIILLNTKSPNQGRF